VLLDVQGGALSLLQQGVDAAARHDPSLVFSNAPKLGIASISIFFDILFMLQHYVWFPAQAPGGAAAQAAGASRPALRRPSGRLAGKPGGAPATAPAGAASIVPAPARLQLLPRRR
jgi:cystinosin